MTASTRRHHGDDPFTATRSWQNRCVLDGFPPVLAKPVDSLPTAARHLQHSAIFFAPPALCGFIIHDDYIIDHDYFDHGYIIIGYLDIDIRLRLQLLIGNNSSQQRPSRHLRPRHSRCDCGRE